MMTNFIFKALIAGLGIAIIAGPLGSLMIWRRMSYFGDTLGHSTLLGVVIALLLNINIYLGLILIGVIVSCLLHSLTKQRHLANDAVLSILSHASLALGLGLAARLQGVRLDLLGYLYGDILSVNYTDIIYIFIVTILGLFIISYFWSGLLSITVDEELAKVEGVPVNNLRWLLILLMAIVFAVAMKLIGVLLIAALLIIPASAARWVTTSPEQMAVVASLIGSIAVGLGLLVSLHWDWPTGPAIVVSATAIFAGLFTGNSFFYKYFFK